MRPCDEPRDFPDWMPHAAPCRRCNSQDWHHPDECTGRLTLAAGIVLGEN